MFKFFSPTDITSPGLPLFFSTVTPPSLPPIRYLTTTIHCHYPTTTIVAVSDCPSLTHRGNTNVGGEKIMTLVVGGERKGIESEQMRE
jgi:hypothetical protein